MPGNQDYWRLRPNAPPEGTPLSPLDSIPDGGAREFRFGRGRSAFAMFVVRIGQQAHGYLNLCPHFSLPLNHEPDRFVEGGHILCVRHFARFRRDDGYCFDGACIGSSLDPVPVAIGADGMLRICGAGEG